MYVLYMFFCVNNERKKERKKVTSCNIYFRVGFKSTILFGNFSKRCIISWNNPKRELRVRHLEYRAKRKERKENETVYLVKSRYYYIRNMGNGDLVVFFILIMTRDVYRGL